MGSAKIIESVFKGREKLAHKNLVTKELSGKRHMQRGHDMGMIKAGRDIHIVCKTRTRKNPHLGRPLRSIRLSQ